MGLEWSVAGLTSLEFSGLLLNLHCLSWHLGIGSKFNPWCSGKCLCGSKWARTAVVLADSGLPSALFPPSACLHPICLLRLQMSSPYRAFLRCLGHSDFSLLWSFDPGCPMILVDWNEPGCNLLKSRTLGYLHWVHKLEPNKNLWTTVIISSIKRHQITLKDLATHHSFDWGYQPIIYSFMWELRKWCETLYVQILHKW